MSNINSPSELAIYHRGPSLTEPPLPALFYFSLSGEESLHLNPYNLPVEYLAHEGIHVFSFTLPLHSKEWDNKRAMERWAAALAQDRDIVTQFVLDSLTNINYLIDCGYVDATRMAVAGLSRGGFMATHLAAADSRIGTVLGYAPLTQLEYLEEFQNLRHHFLVKALDLKQLSDKLIGKRIRFYIGNRDVQVGTEAAFHCVESFVEAAYQQGVRSPQVELFISPSIGFKGHGTPTYIFQDGVDWLKRQIGNEPSNVS